MTDAAKPPSILIVEDEPLIAMMIEDYLDELGYAVVGNVDGVPEALARVAEGGFDAAILDIHLRDGVAAWPVADALAAAGIPYILASGGHSDPEPGAHAAVPVLGKPYSIEALSNALEVVLARAAE
jgi:CheY-like chemotaxis protein